MNLLFLIFFGAVVFPMNFADQHGHHFVYNSQNVSEVASQQRAIVGTALLGGSILMSAWSSFVSINKAVEIDISNRMMTSLTDPTWYMVSGHTVILPPYYIGENEPSTKIQFQSKPNSPYGTEGVVSYQIGYQDLSLVIMWKLSQNYMLASLMKFYVQIVNGAISAENLKNMFDNVDNTQEWFNAHNLHQWQTGDEQGVTWKAAMGTRAITTLKIVISQY